MTYPPLTLDDEMPFGEFEGTKIRDLLKTERGIDYIDWCTRNLDRVTFADGVQERLSDAKSLQHDERDDFPINQIDFLHR